MSTNGEAQERRDAIMAEAMAEPDAVALGDSRKPQFGEWLRGIWASNRNPHRDGQYVKTVVRTGRFNPGTFYELTDGLGAFWQYTARDTVFIKKS